MAAPGQRPEPVFLLERGQDCRGRRQCVRGLRVIAGERAGQRVGEFEGFFASEMSHQKSVLAIRGFCASGFENSDQFLRAYLLAVHGYPFEPMARLNV